MASAAFVTFCRALEAYEALLHTAADAVERKRDPGRSFAASVELADRLVSQDDLGRFGLAMNVRRQVTKGVEVDETSLRDWTATLEQISARLVDRLAKLAIERFEGGRDG
jgi:hypothetical protein